MRMMKKAHKQLDRQQYTGPNMNEMLSTDDADTYWHTQIHTLFSDSP